MGKTTIGWTDAVWNPVRGCRRVSPGCGDSTGGGCYAERQAHRFSGPGLPYEGLTQLSKKGHPRWTGEARLVPDMLRLPIGWRKPRRVFVNSMSDLFHEDLNDDDIDRVFAVMAICAQHETRGGHTFQILTKRAKRMREYFAPGMRALRARWGPHAGRMMEDGDAWADAVYYGDDAPLPGVWLGVSVENQRYADERIPHLLATPAAVRFLSCEPLLGPVDIDPRFGLLPGNQWDCLCAEIDPSDVPCLPCEARRHLGARSGIGWVIVGSESGPGARPMETAWAQSIVDQCVGAGVPVFTKQIATARDRKGEDVSQWPAGRWPREFPDTSGSVGRDSIHGKVNG